MASKGPSYHSLLKLQLEELGINPQETLSPERLQELLALVSRTYRQNRQLSAAHHFLESVIENLPNMTFVKDAQELRFLRFNRAGEEILGLSRDQLIGRNDYDLFPVEQADFFTKKDREVLASGSTLDIPTEKISTALGERVLHTRKVPIPDENGKPLYLLGISEDITDEFQRARRLERQQGALLLLTSSDLAAPQNLENPYRYLIEVSAEALEVERVGVWIFSSEGREMICSDLFSRSEGNHQSGLKLKESQAPTYFAEIRRSPLLVVPSLHEDPRTSELSAFLEPSAGALMDAPILVAGEQVGLLRYEHVGGRRDWLSDERNFAIATSHLAALIVEADHLRRAEAELRSATVAAEAAVRARSSFLATISHEMRTPLNAIVGMSELLLAAQDLEKHGDALRTIRSSSELLLALIDRTLDFSKIEAGRLDLESVPIDLEALIDETLDMVAPSAVETGLALVWANNAKLPEKIFGDPTRLRQILVNLLGNAVKFTHRGGVVLELAMREGKSPEIEIAISDSGIGIAEARLGQLFVPFTQADASTTRRYGGTGLGLAIARHLAEKMGGSLVADSVPDQGSCFRLRLPLESAGATRHDCATALAGVGIVLDLQRDLTRPILERQLIHWGARIYDSRQKSQVNAASNDHLLHLTDWKTPRSKAAGDRPWSLWLHVENHAPVPGPSGPIRPAALLAWLRAACGRSSGNEAPPRSANIESSLADRKPLRILVAEDNPVNQQVAEMQLGSLGYQIDIVHNGQEAVDAARETSYDVILMDLHMPVLDGLEATRLLREEGTANGTSPWVIAVTADIQTEVREALVAAGVDDVITKPVRMKDLEAVLDRVVRR